MITDNRSDVRWAVKISGDQVNNIAIVSLLSESGKLQISFKRELAPKTSMSQMAYNLSYIHPLTLRRLRQALIQQLLLIRATDQSY